MPKFRNKPTIIEAEQFWYGEPLPFEERNDCKRDGGMVCVLTAHNQLVYLEDGDWVVPEPDDRGFYPIKPDIFEKKYERIA